MRVNIAAEILDKSVVNIIIDTSQSYVIGNFTVSTFITQYDHGEFRRVTIAVANHLNTLRSLFTVVSVTIGRKLLL